VVDINNSIGVFGDQVTTMALLDTGLLLCKHPISIFSVNDIGSK